MPFTLSKYVLQQILVFIRPGGGGGGGLNIIDYPLDCSISSPKI